MFSLYFHFSQPQTIAHHEDTAERHGSGGQHRVQKSKRSGRDQDHIVEERPEKVLFDRPKRSA